MLLCLFTLLLSFGSYVIQNACKFILQNSQTADVQAASSHLVDLSDHSVHHLPLKGPEHDGLVLDGIQDEASAGLDHPRPDVVYGGDCDDKPIPGKDTFKID